MSERVNWELTKRTFATRLDRLNEESVTPMSAGREALEWESIEGQLKVISRSQSGRFEGILAEILARILVEISQKSPQESRK